MANDVSNTDVTVSVLLGIQAGGLVPPRNSALKALGDTAKVVGSDPAALAAKVGTSLVVTQVGFSVVQITVNIKSGNPPGVVSELVGMTADILTSLGFTFLSRPLATTPVGQVLTALGGENGGILHFQAA